MNQKTKLHPVCVTAQMPGELANFITETARKRGMTASALLRGLVIQLKESEARRTPVMEDRDAIPSARALVRIAKNSRKGGVL